MTRALLAVYFTAACAVAWLLLPGYWKLVPVVACIPLLAAAWAVTGPRKHKPAHVFDDDQAAELDDWPAELDDWPAKLDDSEGEHGWPGELAAQAGELDPVAYYAAQARAYVQPWIQRGPGEHTRHEEAPVPVELDRYRPAELDDDQAAELGDDQAAELGEQTAHELGELVEVPPCAVCGSLAVPIYDQRGSFIAVMPACGHDPAISPYEVLLEQAQAAFNLLRRMYL